MYEQRSYSLSAALYHSRVLLNVLVFYIEVLICLRQLKTKISITSAFPIWRIRIFILSGNLNEKNI